MSSWLLAQQDQSFPWWDLKSKCNYFSVLEIELQGRCIACGNKMTHRLHSQLKNSLAHQCHHQATKKRWYIQSVEFCHESETRSNSFHWALFFLQLFRMICSRENRRRSVCDAQTHTGAAMHILYKSSRSPIKKKSPCLLYLFTEHNYNKRLTVESVLSARL